MSRKKNAIQGVPKVLDNPADKRRLADLEAQILANLGNGQFFIVGTCSSTRSSHPKKPWHYAKLTNKSFMVR